MAAPAVRPLARRRAIAAAPPGQFALLLDPAPPAEAPPPPSPLLAPTPPPSLPVWRAEDAPSDWPFAGLPPRAFRLIVADPPWAFRTYSDRGLRKSPQAHYRCMDLAAIKALPVAELADPAGCALVLWATAPMLPMAQEAMAAWGFAYKTCGTWAKQSRTGKAWAFGTGHVLRSAAEFWLIGTIGHPRVLAHDVRNLIVAPVREHSRKPDELYAEMARLYGGPRCELFARERRDGWHAWGDEVGRFDPEGDEADEGAEPAPTAPPTRPPVRLALLESCRDAHGEPRPALLIPGRGGPAVFDSIAEALAAKAHLETLEAGGG